MRNGNDSRGNTLENGLHELAAPLQLEGAGLQILCHLIEAAHKRGEFVVRGNLHAIPQISFPYFSGCVQQGGDGYADLFGQKCCHPGGDEEDKERYQTVYAKHEGAVAAPTAGLHFSTELIKRLEIKGVRFAEVTLHTGLGTFRPIEVEDLSKHKMDAEYYQIEEEACKIVNKAKENGRRICSIGTTTMRALESSFTAQKLLKPSEGWTNIFIHPPYNFNIADALVTNFHLPKTSLLIMTCAFAGYDLTMEAYKKAIKDKYRFFSYGDAMLVI